VIDVPGQTPKSPPASPSMTEGPVLVTVDPPSAPYVIAVPRVTGGAATEGVGTKSCNTEAAKNTTATRKSESARRPPFWQIPEALSLFICTAPTVMQGP